MVDQIILVPPKTGSTSGVSNLLGGELERLRRSLTNLGEDLESRALKNFSESIAGEIEKTLEQDLIKATQAFFNNHVRELFEVRDTDKGGTTFMARTKGLYGQDISQTVWQELTLAYARRKRRLGKSPNFFVYSGKLRRQLARTLPRAVVEHLPDFRIEVKRDPSVSGVSYIITTKATRSILTGYGLGNRAYAKAGGRGLQASLLAHLGFPVGESIFTKLQARSTNFRPTLLLLVQHWYTFVLPRVLRDSVAKAANRGIRKSTSGKGSSYLESPG